MQSQPWLIYAFCGNTLVHQQSDCEHLNCLYCHDGKRWLHPMIFCKLGRGPTLPANNQGSILPFLFLETPLHQTFIHLHVVILLEKCVFLCSFPGA